MITREHAHAKTRRTEEALVRDDVALELRHGLALGAADVALERALEQGLVSCPVKLEL